jgi:hypothetical protein
MSLSRTLYPLRFAMSAGLLAFAGCAGAVTVVIGGGAAEIALRVGATAGTISTVTFAPAAATAGDGITLVLGTTNAAAGSAQAPNFGTACAANNVRIWARARAPVAATRTATLQVNSSGNLTSGGNSIPFTDFGWVTSAGTEIPSGNFSGSATQTLMTFQNSNEVSVCLRFQFLNTTIYPSGAYTGQLTFNLAMP